MSERLNERILLGLVEPVVVKGLRKEQQVIARIDTGATKSSIDSRLAAELNLGPIKRTKLVKSAHGNKLRPVIEVEFVLCGKKMKADFTLADRSHMKYKILIGQNVLKQGFLIDPLKKVDVKVPITNTPD